MPIPVTPWCKHHIQDNASLPVHTLLKEFMLLDDTDFPSATRLNLLREAFQPQWQGPLFIAQGELDERTANSCDKSTENDSRYYEEIIACDNSRNLRSLADGRPTPFKKNDPKIMKKLPTFNFI